MIYLRTGLPGASKTLNTIKEIVEDRELKGRPKFYYNIRLFFLDFEVCNSFQGFFYGVHLEHAPKNQKSKLHKIVLAAHREDELVTLDHVPHLRGAFNSWLNSNGAVNLFLSWVFKVYHKSSLKPLQQYLEFTDNPDWTTLQNFNLHFTNFLDPASWYELPKGSVVVLDECQQAFPPRPTGSKVPAHVQQFETHRHGGYDIHLITQDAKLLDSHVRRLVNRHIHYHNPLSSKKVSRLQADKVFDPNDFHDKQKAVSSLITRDPKFYGLYWSADLHTHKLYIPKKLIVLVVVFFAVPALMFVWISSRFFGGGIDESTSGDNVYPVSPHVNQVSYSENHSYVLPSHAFSKGNHPLAEYCDEVTLSVVEAIRTERGTIERFYLQCERFTKDESGSYDDFRHYPEAELFDFRYLARLGYRTRFERGLLSVSYNEVEYVFKTF